VEEDDLSETNDDGGSPEMFRVVAIWFSFLLWIFTIALLEQLNDGTKDKRWGTNLKDNTTTTLVVQECKGRQYRGHILVTFSMGTYDMSPLTFREHKLNWPFNYRDTSVSTNTKSFDRSLYYYLVSIVSHIVCLDKWHSIEREKSYFLTSHFHSCCGVVAGLSHQEVVRRYVSYCIPIRT
jgi:hypothetical protein